MTVEPISVGNATNAVSFATSDYYYDGYGMRKSNPWPAAAKTCFQNFMKLATPLFAKVAGNASNSLTVMEYVVPNGGGGAYDSSTIRVGMSVFPNTSNNCQSDSGWYDLNLVEDHHAWGADAIGRLESHLPNLPSHIEVGAARAVSGIIGSQLAADGTWNVSQSNSVGGVELNYADALNDVGDEALNGTLDEGTQGGPTEVTATQIAQQADYVLLTFSQSNCASGAFADCGAFNAAFKNAQHAFINEAQRLFTIDEFFGIADSVKNPNAATDGENPGAWLASRASTFSTGTDGNHFGIAAVPRENPAYLLLLASNQANGKRKAITTGSANVDMLDTAGKVVFAKSYALSASHEINMLPIMSGLARGAYTLRATYLDATGNTLAIATNVLGSVDPTVDWNWDLKTTRAATIFLFGTTKDGSGNLFASTSAFTVTNGSVDYTVPGIARVTANCTGNPCAITANGKTLSVPVPLTRAVAVPKQ